jgi:hypothetical protein
MSTSPLLMQSHTPDEAIAEIASALYQEPVFITGSCVAAQQYGIAEFSDVDVFVPTKQVLMTTTQLLLCQGATMNERFDRVWYRWKKYGFNGWHTNSMELHTKTGLKVNLIYKEIGRKPLGSLAEVVQSFDFGFLAMGYSLEFDDKLRDMRGYLFPTSRPGGPYPMMEDKRINWIRGFFGQFTGLREPDRYSRFCTRGYDLSLVKPDLIEGYRQSALYHSTLFEEEKRFLAEVWTKLADLIEDDDHDQIIKAYKEIDKKDSLDQIMEKLDS